MKVSVLQAQKQVRRATELWTADHMISEETQAKVGLGYLNRIPIWLLDIPSNIK